MPVKVGAGEVKKPAKKVKKTAILGITVEGQRYSADGGRPTDTLQL